MTTEKIKQVHLDSQTNRQQLDEEFAGWVGSGVGMVHWQVEEGGLGLPRDLLWKVSKQGIWNHVTGRTLFGEDMPDRAWIANNPDIVHSFESLDASGGRLITPPGEILSYRKLPAIPGRALWQTVHKPDQLLGLLTEHGKKKLLRLRLDEDTGEIREIGAHLKFYFKRPDEIPPRLMEEIIAMVDAGGSVDITHVRANLKKAYLIGYVMENGVIAGNSSLKHPRQVFIDRLKSMTGLDFSKCVERGYTSVRPEYRAMGIGARLLEGLTERATVKVFSIISEDNLATQKIAIRNNTRKITTYFSDKLKKKMGVWMPEYMIPEDMVTTLEGKPDQESDK